MKAAVWQIIDNYYVRCSNCGYETYDKCDECPGCKCSMKNSKDIYRTPLTQEELNDIFIENFR